MIEVQKAVLIKEGKYLILLRSKRAKFFPDHWDFPGGKLEPGEEPTRGIIREVKEETTLDIIPKEVVGKYTMELKGIPHRFTVYSIESVSGEIKLTDEHQEFRWSIKQDIQKLTREPFIDLYFKENE